MKIRILLVDDHPVVLDGLAGALSGFPDLEVAARATTLATARSALARASIDVGLVDVRLPDGSGLALIAEQADGSHQPSWIVLSSFETPQHLSAALAAGAAGYLVKAAPTPEVIEAITRVASGQLAFTEGQLERARSAGKLRLTDRDRQIVEAMMAGRSTDEIAGAMHISTKTVEAHLSRLYAFAGVSTRTELALRADREDWLRLPAP